VLFSLALSAGRAPAFLPVHVVQEAPERWEQFLSKVRRWGFSSQLDDND
jgi:hypothetical protein